MELRIDNEITRGNFDRAAKLSDKLATILKERGKYFRLCNKFQIPDLIHTLLLPVELNAAKARKEFAEKLREAEEKKRKKPQLQWTYVIIRIFRRNK